MQCTRVFVFTVSVLAVENVKAYFPVLAFPVLFTQVAANAH